MEMLAFAPLFFPNGHTHFMTEKFKDSLVLKPQIVTNLKQYLKLGLKAWKCLHLCLCSTFSKRTLRTLRQKIQKTFSCFKKICLK